MLLRIWNAECATQVMLSGWRVQSPCEILSTPPCSGEKKQAVALPVAVAAGAGAMMANPLVAEAAVTPSLKNLFGAASPSCSPCLAFLQLHLSATVGRIPRTSRGS